MSVQTEITKRYQFATIIGAGAGIQGPHFIWKQCKRRRVSAGESSESSSGEASRDVWQPEDDRRQKQRPVYSLWSEASAIPLSPTNWGEKHQVIFRTFVVDVPRFLGIPLVSPASILWNSEQRNVNQLFFETWNGSAGILTEYNPAPTHRYLQSLQLSPTP